METVPGTEESEFLNVDLDAWISVWEGLVLRYDADKIGRKIVLPV